MTRESEYQKWANAAILARQAEEFFLKAHELARELDIESEFYLIEDSLRNFAQSLRSRAEPPIYYSPVIKVPDKKK